MQCSTTTVVEIFSVVVLWWLLLSAVVMTIVEVGAIHLSLCLDCKGMYCIVSILIGMLHHLSYLCLSCSSTTVRAYLDTGVSMYPLLHCCNTVAHLALVVGILCGSLDFTWHFSISVCWAADVLHVSIQLHRSHLCSIKHAGVACGG